MNNEPQDIEEYIANQFFSNNTIWFSDNEIKELFTIIKVNDKINSNNFEIDLSQLVQHKPALWAMLHDFGKKFTAKRSLKSDQNDLYTIVKYIAKYKTQLQFVPNDLDTLDKIWECYVWENTYHAWLHEILSQKHKTEFYIDDFKPMLIVHYD